MPDKDFIERSMYHSARDKNARFPAMLYGAGALAFWFIGMVSYLQILNAEKTGKRMQVDRFIKLLYDIGGSTGVLLGCLALGALCVFAGYRSYKNKKGERYPL